MYTEALYLHEPLQILLLTKVTKTQLNRTTNQIKRKRNPTKTQIASRQTLTKTKMKLKKNRTKTVTQTKPAKRIAALMRKQKLNSKPNLTVKTATKQRRTTCSGALTTYRRRTMKKKALRKKAQREGLYSFRMMTMMIMIKKRSQRLSNRQRTKYKRLESKSKSRASTPTWAGPFIS